MIITFYDVKMMTSNESKDEDNRKSYEKVASIYNQIRKNGLYVKKIMKRLLQTEGDINYRILEGSKKVPNLLHAASHEPKILNLLLDYGADFTRKDNEGRTVIHKIIRERTVHHRQRLLRKIFEDECVDLVLDAHVKFNNYSNPCDENGISHFHAASMTNNAIAAEFFLNNGVDVDLAVNADSPFFPSHTPLQLAVRYTCPDVVQVLLDYGANIYLKNAEGLSLLHLMVKRITAKCEDTIAPRFSRTLGIFTKYIIDNGIIEDDLGFSILHLACLLRDQSLVENILDQVTNINEAIISDSTVCPGFTALHFAAFSNVQIFKLLLENGANIDAKDARGHTPLDLCLKYYSVIDVHSILLSIREWRNIVLSDNETKLIDVVSVMDTTYEFVSFLNSTKFATTTFVPFDSSLWPGYTLLHLAVAFAKKQPDSCNSFFEQRNDVEIVAECLKRGGDMTVADAKGSTALHLAFRMEKRTIVEYLLNHHDKIVNPVDEQGLSHFHIACTLGHENAVKTFLSSGVDVNSPVKSTFRWYTFSDGDFLYDFSIIPGSTALHINAANGNNDKITKMLLKHGADVSVRDENDFTPVHRLLAKPAFKLSSRMCDALLSVKNLKNSVTHFGFSHLHVASYFGHCHAIKKLLKLGADINAPLTSKYDVRTKDRDEFHFEKYGNPHTPLSFLSKYPGYTPLHFSGIQGNYKATLLLIEKGANLRVKDVEEISPLRNLMDNVYHCDELYRMLAKNSIVLTHLEEEFGITKLHLACHLGNVRSVRSLIHRGVDVNAKVHSDSRIWKEYTPLQVAMASASKQGREKSFIGRLKKILRLLLKHGADPLLANDNNDTCIHMVKPPNDTYYASILRKLAPFASILFESLDDFSVNPSNDQGFSLFHIACTIGNVPVVKQYLGHGVDVNQAISPFSREYGGCAPLHLAINCAKLTTSRPPKAIKSDTDTLSYIIDLLLNYGANVNAIDADGNTPLHILVRLEASRGFFIEKLISNGADVHAINANGESPLAMFLHRFIFDWDDLELFLKNGCDINVYNSVSQLGYVHSCLIDHIIETRRILHVNFMGRTILHNVVSRTDGRFAAYNETISRITVEGCDIDHRDNEGKTALHLAASFDNEGAISQLLRHGADINITDKCGRSAFAYCYKFTQPDDDILHEDDFEAVGVLKLFARHIYKLKFCGQRVSGQNERLRDEVAKEHGFDGEEFDSFHAEIENSKGINIDRMSLTLYEFLMNSDVDVIYMDMTNEERREVDEFFKNIDEHKFQEIDGLLKLKYRQVIKNTKLVEPALASLSLLIKCQLPDLCCRNILKFLQNEDLKRLIAAAT